MSERLFDGDATASSPTSEVELPELDPFELVARRARAGSETPCRFGLCDGSGFLVDEQTNTARDCRCRSGLVADRRTAKLEGRLPKRFRGVSFDRHPVPDIERVAPTQVQLVRSYVRAIESNLDAGRGLWLTGSVGTGKTTLAMIVSKAAIDARRSVAIYSLPRLLNVIRDSIGAESRITDFLERLAAVDLLHIDDLGAENTTDWVLEQLYLIVNARYEDERSILVTTNLMPDELSDRLGHRTVSRLVEICGDLIPLDGEDKRKDYQVQARGRA